MRRRSRVALQLQGDGLMTAATSAAAAAAVIAVIALAAVRSGAVGPTTASTWSIE